MSKHKILIADNLDQEGLDILKSSGLFEIDFRKKTTREELLEIIPDFAGLIIRSATKVDKEVIEKATSLKVVIRAGVGVDNIDIPGCSQKGIVVMNAPAGNSVSTAEQAIALMFSLARKTPQANQSMKEKKWEKNRFTGVQLTGKTMGVIGLGRIGKEVVKRAKGLQMNVLGFDPYIPRENLEYLEVELTTVEKILAESDFVTVHTPLTESTKGLVNLNNLSKIKKGIRLINCARGGIYDEAALAEGLKSGQIAGVGLDVFTEEPPKPDFPLYESEDCIMTPHLGASTDEAQIEVAKESAESMIEYFRSGVARNSLNFPTLDPREMDTLAPWFNLCDNLGIFMAQLMTTPVKAVELEYRGSLVKLNLQPLEIAFTRGLLSVAMGGDAVNLVNAPILAKNRSIKIHARKSEDKVAEPSEVKITVTDEKETLSLRATVGFSGAKVISLNGFPIEFKPVGSILYIRNRDVPKVVGELGNILGDAGINIASIQLSRAEKGGIAQTVLLLDESPGADLLKKLREKEFIVEARFVKV